MYKSFTIEVIDCSDAAAVGFAHNAGGPVIDKTGSLGWLDNGNHFNWDVVDTNYWLTVQQFTHDNTRCGTFALSVSADDATWATYVSFDSATDKINIDYSLRANQNASQRLIVTVTATNTHGATYSTNITVWSFFCNRPRTPSGDYVCRFYTSIDENNCDFPKNYN